eukprot:365707-Chlamydomonas_euryale.AAC.20
MQAQSLSRAESAHDPAGEASTVPRLRKNVPRLASSPPTSYVYVIMIVTDGKPRPEQQLRSAHTSFNAAAQLRPRRMILL